jgi:hypothetical protein
MVQKQAKRVFAWVSPADSFGTAIGVGIGIGVGIELTNPLSAKLLADRVAALSELREHGHTTIEQCLLLATSVDPRSSLCHYPRQCFQRDGVQSAPTMRTGVDPYRYAVLSHARSSH